MVCSACGKSYPDAIQICPQCGVSLSLSTPTPVSQTLTTGTRLRDNAFAIGKVLGQGGFGITYLGSDLQLNRPVAIKEFFPEGCVRQGRRVQPSRVPPPDYQSGKTRFLDEARVLAQFKHPGIVHVYTSFEDNNTAYMVMEYLKGKTLLSLVETEGPLPETQAVEYVEKVCGALEMVHQANLLHRDIKPENIMVTDDGRIVLVDFGAARQFVAGKTRSHSVMLTPAYAPLEQHARHARRGPPSDIYAVGASLYHLLTGQLPATAPDRTTGVTLRAARSLNPNVSQAVSEAVMWAMEIKMEKRPQSVREFLRALKGQVEARRPARHDEAAAVSLKFANEEAASVPDLITLCDKYPDEAEGYLFNGYLEEWLRIYLGEMALVQHAQTIRGSYARDRRKGLELFVRELCKSVGTDAYPKLSPQPARVDLGQLPQGAQASASIRLRNEGRGLAWGSVKVEPEMPGISVTPVFESAYAQIDVRVDSLHLTPGDYRGNLVVQAQGVPNPCRIPLQYRVLSLTLHADPRVLDLGPIPHGERANAALKVTCTPASGRFSGNAWVDPLGSGVTVSGYLNGNVCELEVAADTSGLDADQPHEAYVRLSTNAGELTVPVRFGVTSRRAVLVAWTAGIGVATGVGMWLVRALLASIGSGLQTWYLSYSAHPTSALLWACGGFGVCLVGGVVATIVELKERKKR